MVIASIIVGIIIGILQCLVYIVFGQIFGYIFLTKITFPGVIVHECSHALGAILTGAKIVKFHPFYMFVRSGGTLGQVEVIFSRGIIISSIQRYFVSVGPIIGGTLAVIKLYDWQVYTDEIMALKWWLIISIILHMDLSEQDIKVLLPGLPVMILIGISILLLMRFIG